jgi:hypothetical protein
MTKNDITNCHVLLATLRKMFRGATIGELKMDDLCNSLAAVLHSFAPEALFIVRFYDGMDNQWMDVSGSVSHEEANKIWLEKTENGTKHIAFKEIDYYKVFPADTRMIFSEGFGEH